MTWLLERTREREPAGARAKSWLALMMPGLVLAGVVGLGGVLIERVEEVLTGHRFLEALVIAMLLGVLIRNLTTLPQGLQPGTTFASKTVLEIAVVILGASIDVQKVVEAGSMLFLAVTIGVLLGMASSFLLGKILGLESRLAYMVAVGNSICGNSAIAAVAPVLKADRREIASAIGLTAIAGVVIVVALPLLVPILDITDYQYGVVAGMAVYAVPQVVAAAFAVSRLSGEVATLVKLVRVMFIGPVVLGTGLYMRWKGSADYQVRKSQLLPWFVIGFFIMLSLRSLGLIPVELVQPIRDVGKGLTIWALAGLGLGVEMSAIKSVGPRVGATSIMSMLLLVALSLLLISVLGLGA
jgi:uncharacterized integral membrane protein (TIGR00698 family)